MCEAMGFPPFAEAAPAFWAPGAAGCCALKGLDRPAVTIVYHGNSRLGVRSHLVAVPPSVGEYCRMSPALSSWFGQARAWGWCCAGASGSASGAGAGAAPRTAPACNTLPSLPNTRAPLPALRLQPFAVQTSSRGCPPCSTCARTRALRQAQKEMGCDPHGRSLFVSQSLEELVAHL
jgi:hypothetical protein